MTQATQTTGRAPTPAPAGQSACFNRHSRRLRAVVLLGGSVNVNDFSRAIDRSMLDLPIDAHHTVLDQWLEQIQACEAKNICRTDQVLVQLDQDAPAPQLSPLAANIPVDLSRDTANFRGTGGILRDLAEGFDPSDLLLVANARQILLQPLATQLSLLFEQPAPASLIAHTDGTPVGLMLLRCDVFASIADRGYVDLKEQALPKIAQHHPVRVVSCSQPTGAPIRTFSSYLHALRLLHQHAPQAAETASVHWERWRSSFSLIEPGAEVAESAQLNDTVVLRGGRVEPGAVVARCVVCPGGVVSRRRTVVDQLVTARSGH